jgi:sec-independent protein translocase protein TatB
MFGIDSGELLIIAVVALVVIGPKDLPRVMRAIGNFVGKARGMASHFRSGVDTMIRESELADMEKKWKADNEKIMREHPLLPSPPEPRGQEDWPAKDDTVYGEAPYGEPWPEPTDIAPKPAPPRRTVRASDNRPKAPPRRVGATAPGVAAPPIPAKAATAAPPSAPTAKDEGA